MVRRARKQLVHLAVLPAWRGIGAEIRLRAVLLLISGSCVRTER
jgi:hypothetical protein